MRTSKYFKLEISEYNIYFSRQSKKSSKLYDPTCIPEETK